MFDRRLLINFNWLLLVPLLVLCLVGYLNLYSIADVHGIPYHSRQLKFYLLGLLLIFLLILLDYQYLKYVIREFYLLGVVILILVLFIGQEGSFGSSQRWLQLGPLRFQPAEAIKILVLLTLALYCSKRDYGSGMGFKDLIWPGFIIGLPFLLIVKQPDLGTALHLLISSFSMLLFIRIKPLVLMCIILTMALFIAGIFAIGSTLGWNTLVKMKLLKEYQVARVEHFFEPDKGEKDASWQIRQSKISIGNGEMFGRGYMEGTQRANRFLPIQPTDFVFAVFAEQWGFLGSLFILGMFAWLLVAGLLVTRGNRDSFGCLLVVGFSALIFWQMFINIGMVCGILPVVGIPLPYISYGGTSVLSLMFAVGLILNISMRRFKFTENDLDKNHHLWEEEPLVENPPLPICSPIRKDYLCLPSSSNNYRKSPKPWLKYLKDNHHL